MLKLSKRYKNYRAFAMIMTPVTNTMLDARREKKLRRHRHRAQHSPFQGWLCIPRMGNERLLNEAASLRFIADRTTIPVPCFEDDGAVYLITEFVDGVTMAELEHEHRKVVEEELEMHIETMRTLQSNTWGGPSGLVIPPHRILKHASRLQWNMRPRETPDLVFCHNDLSTHNVIVDPGTL
ncbi:hypothetical protein PWT90_04190 [Aphanocladium album]|nr:hypothetical protein PWT90_04190 [Aphanocladium album]